LAMSIVQYTWYISVIIPGMIPSYSLDFDFDLKSKNNPTI